jgi:hypothetical protein
MTLMHIYTHKGSKKSSFAILRFFYDLLCIFKVFSQNMHKRKKEKENTFASRPLDFS